MLKTFIFCCYRYDCVTLFTLFGSLPTASVNFFHLLSTTWANNFLIFHSWDPVYTQKLALTSMRSVEGRILQKHEDLKDWICVKIYKIKISVEISTDDVLYHIIKNSGLHWSLMQQRKEQYIDLIENLPLL